MTDRFDIWNAPTDASIPRYYLHRCDHAGGLGLARQGESGASVASLRLFAIDWNSVDVRGNTQMGQSAARRTCWTPILTAVIAPCVVDRAGTPEVRPRSRTAAYRNRALAPTWRHCNNGWRNWSVPVGLKSSSSDKPPRAVAHTDGPGSSGNDPSHELAPDHVDTPPPDAPAVEVPDISSTHVPKQKPRPSDRAEVPRVDPDAPTVRSAGDGVSTEWQRLVGQLRLGLRLLLGSLASLVWAGLVLLRGKCAFYVGKMLLYRWVRVIFPIIIIVCIPLLWFRELGGISEFIVGLIFNKQESLVEWKTIIILLSILLVYAANKLIDSFLDGVKGIIKNICEAHSIAKQWNKVWSRWFKIRKAQRKRSISDVFRSMRVATQGPSEKRFGLEKVPERLVTPSQSAAIRRNELRDDGERTPRQPKESEDTDKESKSGATIRLRVRDNVRKFGDILLWIAIMLSFASVLFLCVSSYHKLEDFDENDNQDTLKRNHAGIKRDQ